MLVLRNKPGIDCLKHLAFWALVIVLSAVPLRAQKGTPPSGGSGGSGGSHGPTGGKPPVRPGGPTSAPGMQPQPGFGVFVPTLEPLPKTVVIEDKTCLPWDLPAPPGATVSGRRPGD